MTTEALTVDQLKEAKEAVSLFDRDGDGIIEAREVLTVLRSLGYNPKIDEQEAILAAGDKKGGKISFQQFLEMCELKLKDLDAAEELIAAFKNFDRGGDTGKVSTMELKCVLEELGELLTDAEVEELIQEADPKNEGSFNYEEFVRELLKFK
eukprot:GHVU01161946.1.p1 GENE.GHVU01161946.1~~GHVU01161946.1.p1  ORF type:complete len:152 (+),score=35.39 GHVU01161946.1:40-495(+)